MQMSTLGSYQYSNNNIVHLGVREMQAVCTKPIPKKEWKRKKMVFIDVQFSITKKLATEQCKTARHCL